MPHDFASPSADEEWRIGDYVLLHTIGKGSCATVCLARHVLTGTEVVVKAISRQGLSRFFQEVHCLKLLNHPNITKLFEVIATQSMFFLVMEQVSGMDLLEYLENYGRMNEEEARTVFRQVVSAVQYCHQRGIVHRDLKPDNILVDRHLTIKVADFGFSRENKDDLLSTFCGTAYYMAPEILRDQTYDGRKFDVWSLGVVLYKMVTGVEPFAGDTFGKVKKQILSGQFIEPHFMSREGKELIKNLLAVNPSHRPTLEDVLKDPWLNKGQEEALRPYSEPPWGDLDPQVTETMQNLGFNQAQIQESVTQKKFDRVMGTYLILRMMKTKMPGRTVRVRPCPSPGTCSTSSSQEVVRPLDEKTKEPSIPPNCLSLRVTTSPPDLETRTTSPPFTLELRTDTPSSHENSPHAGQPKRDARASPPGHSQGRQRLGRRVLSFFSRFTCCGLSTNKKRLKRTKVKPM